jgi:hypothetical protein
MSTVTVMLHEVIGQKQTYEDFKSCKAEDIVR